MTHALQNDIERLRTLTVSRLRERYRELLGEESHSSNRAHLFRRIAWRLQARAEGDLSERARERASQLADDVDLRLRAPKEFWQELKGNAPEQAASKSDPRLPPSGTLLERHYRNRTIQVQVLDSGFEYNGRRYGSLSAVAYQVTGTRWNGFLFFGLSKDQSHG